MQFVLMLPARNRLHPVTPCASVARFLKTKAMAQTVEDIVVSAPGKVILHGEHAVVYGKVTLAHYIIEEYALFICFCVLYR